MARTMQALLNGEKSLAELVPYSAHVSEHNVRTGAGDLVTVIRLDGAAHEAADPEDVQAWHEALNGLLKNLAQPDLALWRHTVRRPRNEYPAGEFLPGFAADLNDKYAATIAAESMMVNDLYLTLVLRGPPAMFRLFGGGQRRERNQVAMEIEEQCARLDELARNALAALEQYQPSRLGMYERSGLSFSSALEFLAFLVNGEWQPMPVPRQRISDAICTSRLTFGVETGEVRGPVSRQYLAMLAANEYPDTTQTGELNQLLSLPFGFVLTQSFAYLDRAKALSMIDLQRRKLIGAKDAGISQIEALEEAADDVQSNRVAFGEHHLSLLLTADSTKELEDRLSMARSNLSESGFIVAREDLALEAAYAAQLPGNFRYRPRPAPISSRNFAGLMALHNFPHGKADGNQWGPAVTLLKTTSETPFYFNFHLPTRGRRASGAQTDDERVAGNTLIIGPTGAGKTVIQTFLLAQCEKFKPTVFTFDKDYGQEIFIRAMGGRYSVLKTGLATGFNPLRLEQTPANQQFLVALVKKLTENPRSPFTAEHEADIAAAVRGLAALPPEHRRMSVLRQYFSEVEPDGIHARLGKWCEGGSLGWVFDNPTDEIDLTGTRYFGFDVTEFLDNDEIRTPVVMYLFHRMEALIGAGRFILNMDEFWKMLQDPHFQKKAEDVVNTIRKRDGFAVFSTQSPQAVLKSPIAHSLVGQCVTQVFLPNPRADAEDYVDGFKLTHREFEIVKDEMPAINLRGFLYKQGSNAAVCELNLAGFNDELAVLSGTSTTVDLARRAIAQAGEDPAAWLPVFHRIRRGA